MLSPTRAVLTMTAIVALLQAQVGSVSATSRGSKFFSRQSEFIRAMKAATQSDAKARKEIAEIRHLRQRESKARFQRNLIAKAVTREEAEAAAGVPEFMSKQKKQTRQLDDANNNNNNNNYNYNNGNGNGYQAAYVGAYCGGGGSRVNLGVFSDAACTVKSDDSLFQKYYYYSLPYTTTSIIGRECFSCDAAEYEFNENNGNGNNNYNNNYEISQMCEEVHERSAKCEKNLKIGTSQSAYSNNGYTRYYPHTESCQFIHSTLSGLESVTRSNGRSLRTARAFAWIFAVTTLACVGYIVWLHSEKRKRSSVDLNSTYGGGAGGWS
mmetsp:Transcript_2907/g.6225  ORF Transcript_2907/g.6225 Transcript_2907/m.6225 type:complete len:324 (+) Transcript_2907:369-1340(+)